MYTTTRVEICNAALNLIGDKSITSFDENSPTAERCRKIYDITRKSVLRDHPWSCAKKRVILAPVTTYPAFGYSHAFPLPRDFLRLVDANKCKYEIEDRHILANAEQINLIYVYDNDNEDTWDSLLVEAMSLKMASRLCKAITGSDSSAESAKAEYLYLLKRARNINAQERLSEELEYSEASYIGDRY